MLKNGVKVIKKNELHYIVKDEGRILKFSPWLGNVFSLFYDFIMKNSGFLKKFGADIDKHYSRMEIPL